MYVLIHSPLVGVSTWQGVAHELKAEGFAVAVPALHDTDDSGLAYWQQHAAAIQEALKSVPSERRLILVGHSGAGSLLPAIRQQLPQPIAAYVFADAGLPRAGASRLDAIATESPAWFQSFHEFLLAGGRFPAWRDEDLADEIPDEQLRMALESELQPRALPFWTEPIPVFAGWPDAPCAYLQFSAAYDSPAAQARAQGWVYRHLPGGHFLPLVEPQAVARALISLPWDLGVDPST